MKRGSVAELRVVLDTSALYTGSANYFVRKEVADLITQHRDLPDLRIAWYVPSVVKDERHFQMISEAQRFLDPIAKLERLLGHNLNITTDILDSRVLEAIEKQVGEHTINVLPLQPAKIDWTRLAADAAFRRAPFSSGEKEKGFRDALVVEAFVQLVTESPTSPSTCRVVLVSGDELLRKAASDRIPNAQNVYVLESVDALKGLINTLGSAVDEHFIAAIQPKAERLFFGPGDQETLYYRWQISTALNEKLTAAPIVLPNGAERYAVENWSISPPRFLRKERQRISWASRFGAQLRAVRMVHASSPQRTRIILPGIEPESPIGDSLQSSMVSVPSSSANIRVDKDFWGDVSNLNRVWLSTGGHEQTVGSGLATIDVNWTVSVTTALGLKSPKLDTLSFVEVVW